MESAIRDDVGLVELLLIATLFFLTILWMRGWLWYGKGLLHSPVRHVDSAAISPIKRAAHTISLRSSYSTQVMFANAVAKHDAATVKQKTLPQQSLLSSSPLQRPTPHQKPSFKLGSSILNPAPSSTLNVPFKKQVPFLSGHGVKRTSSGLEKGLSTHGSFESTSPSGSQSKPIIIDENAPVQQDPAAVYLCEDDFDSDIDIDVEEPVLRPSTAQSPPKQSSGASRSAFYPTLPRQQAHSHLDTRDTGHNSFASTRFEPLHVPSQSLPWSSSPPEHMQPPLHQAGLSRFEYKNDFAPAQDIPRDNGIPPPRKEIVPNKDASKPSKKRTLPWKVTQDQEAQAAQNGAPPPQFHTITQTPANKSSMWAPSASAVKNQQKVFREANKKKSKFAEAQEHAAELVQRQQTKNKQLPKVFLSEEQQNVLNLVQEDKKSVFFTGSAGTGKSVLLREIISSLRRVHLREPDRVAVTASTGLAACNIGGVTLHSFAGIGLGKEDVPELVKKIRRNQKAKQRWMRTKILVIDEVSMVDGDLFDKLEAIARQIRNNGRPFGGIQLVITGDFFQLPPVPEGYGRVAKFAFDAASWTTSIQHTIGLHQVFRQKDPIFAGMLNEMREGKLSQSSISAFKKLNRPLEPGPMSTMATELFPTRNEVEAANSMRMNQLVGDVKTYEARDGGAVVDKASRDRLLANCMAPENINLKKGAQVMLIKNIDESLVNGSIGTVMGFMSESTFDRYTDHEEEYMSAQGDSLRDRGNPLHERTKQAANRLMDNLIGSTTQLYPVVRFTLADNTTRDLLCQRETWKVELPNGEVQASRSQIPLILAWALSIHKAQGQTLERVKVDLGKVFEKGQAYVALSRATSMTGLQVLRFDATKVMAHDKVRTFYSNLSSVESASGGAKKKRKSAAPVNSFSK